MTTAKPLARYSAPHGALASGSATAELHHHRGRDPDLDGYLRHPVFEELIALDARVPKSRLRP